MWKSVKMSIRDFIISFNNSLDLQDKLSLIFLLFDNEEDGLKAMSEAYRGTPVFSLWLRNNDDGNWLEKICESLFNIQNFKVLNDFGLTCEDIKKKYYDTFRKPFLCSVRTELYKSMSNVPVNEFYNLVHRFGKPQVKFVPEALYQTQFYEVYVFSWIYQKVVTVSQLRGHLEYLVTRPSEVLTKFQMNPISNSLMETGNDFCDNTEECYPIIDSSDVGLLIILNQDFKGSEEQKERVGAHFDIRALEETMKKKNFKCICIRNVPHDQIFPKIDECAKANFKKTHSILMVTIMTHGEINCIYGSDDIPVATDGIRKILTDEHHPNLRNKPKIIIFQSCRGNNMLFLKKNIETDSPIKMSAPLLDYIICWSTLPGYYSYRCINNGTWFIQTLCKVINENGHESFEKIFKKTISELRYSIELTAQNYDYELRMIPEYQSALTKELYLVKRN